MIMRYWMEKNKERLQWAIAWRLPRWLVLYAAMRLGVEATTGEYSSQVVPDLRFMDALQRWKK